MIYALIVLALGAILAVSGCPGKNAASNSRTGNTTAANGNGAGGANRFAQFRESHKYTFQLTRLAGNIGKLEEEKKAPLTPAQAKAVLAVLEPLRGKPKLTQDDAKVALKGLKAALNEQQLTEIGKMKEPERRPGQGGQGGPGMGPGGGQRGPGQGPGAGQPPAMNPDAMKNFNPFNLPKDSPMGGRSAERWNKFFDALTKKAGGK